MALSGVAGTSPGLSETRVQPPRYSAARIGTVVHRAIPRLFENCLSFESGQRMPLHRLFKQRGEYFVQQRSYAAQSVRFLQLFRSDGTENLSQRGGAAAFSDDAIEECQTRIPPRPVSFFLFYGNLLQRHALSDLRTNHTRHQGAPVDTR